MFVSFFKRIYPNWTIPAYPLMVLSLGLALNTHFLMNKKIFNIFLGVNAFVSLLGVLLLFGFTFALPGRILPTKKMVGWRDFSSFVLDQKLSNPDIGFVISESYDFTSELNFYTPSLNVYNTTLGGRRMNQFDIWQSHSDRLKEIRGSSVLLVLSSPEASDLFKPYFSRIERLPVKKDFSYDFSGESLRTVYLFRGYDYNGKPFQNAESH